MPAPSGRVLHRALAGVLHGGFVALTLGALLLVPPSAAAQSSGSPSGLRCDLSGYDPASGIRAELEGPALLLEWPGAAGEDLRLELGVVEGEPVIRRLALRGDRDGWTTVATDVRVEYRVVEGFRRISNQQLQPLRGLGVEITQEVVDRYKWDVFWDAPLDLSTETRSGNPPPAEGVAGQPGLPRSPDEIRRGSAVWEVSGCAVESDGARVAVRFPGVRLGSFSGALVLTAYRGTNLIRTEVVASTELPSVAYKYDVGLSGLAISGGSGGNGSGVRWRDLGGQRQAYFLGGPPNEDPVALRAANRLVVAATRGAAIAAFPPPHTFFWAREVEINVGYNWYRKDDDASFSFGIRQGEEEVVERYRANWSLYSAPPGTEQRMAGYFYPTLGEAGETSRAGQAGRDGQAGRGDPVVQPGRAGSAGGAADSGAMGADRAVEAAFGAALAFTNGDVYRPLQGYRVMGSHYHTNMGRELLASGSLDTRLADFEVLRSAGIDIAGPVDRPRDETQLEELHWLFEGAERHSDSSFMVLPEMENSNLLGGHWDLLFSHPVYYVDDRPPGTPLVTEHPEYGRIYNIGSAEDVMTMVEAEDMLVYMPHPRTKGSTGYPDAVRETPQFLSDRYRGVGWRWGMGSDLSEKRLSEKRVIPLLDDMNNWIADTDLQPKYPLGITETYFKAPGDDVYANGPVSYLRLDALPEPGDYAPIVDALERGEYFVTSGEVLIPSHSWDVAAEVPGDDPGDDPGDGPGREVTLTAEVEWTFPLEFVEVVYGDGETTGRTVVSATDLPPFGSHTFVIPFDATGQAWARFAAWDSAGNGAMTMPVRLGTP